MTPSNPTNSQPLIYRIADALGVFHLVAPVNHTHAQSEIEGLTDALAAKQDALTFDSTPTAGSNNPVTSGGVESKLIPVIDANELDTLFAGDTSHDVYIINDPDLGQSFLFLQKRAARPPHYFYYQEIVGSTGLKIRASRDKGEYDEWATTYYLTKNDVDSTPTLYSDNPVSSGGVKAAIDNIMNTSSRQIILTKTADGYQFASAESELEEFVNRITSWTGESVPTIITCVVITNDGTEGMPAMLTYSLTSRYLDFRINIATYRLEGQIMIDDGTYSSDMLMELTDMSYVFAE